jgi:transposase-like protein
LFVRKPRFTEAEARDAIARSDCWSGALRLLGVRPAGGNHATLQKWARAWGIPSDHFDPRAVRARSNRHRAIPLEEVLVRNSTYDRGKLKRRLYKTGIKERRCELCGQDEIWHGREMSLILDHINGDAMDNRLENLRIVCPNCAATLDTHCGRNVERIRRCRGCSAPFRPRHGRHVYCSNKCAGKSPSRRDPRPGARRAERQPYEQLLREIAETSWSAVGRKYGVSDNAIRKWVRAYERELEPAGEGDRQGGPAQPSAEGRVLNHRNRLQAETIAHTPSSSRKPQFDVTAAVTASAIEPTRLRTM